jgi:hypothetical protein
MAVVKKGVGFNPIILVIGVLSFVLMLVVEGVLIRPLLRGKRGAKTGTLRDDLPLLL